MRALKATYLPLAGLSLILAACTPTGARGPATTSPDRAPAPPTQSADKNQASSAPKRYTAKELLETTRLRMGSSSQHVFNPQGNAFLASSDDSGIFNVIRVDLNGQVTPLTQSKDNAMYALSYFPADERVLIASDSGGNERYHVFVREMDGSIKDLTPGENTRANYWGWNADNSQFYVSTNERDPKVEDLYAYDAKTYKRSLVYKNKDKMMDLEALSPSGKQIILSKATSNANNNLYLVDLNKSRSPKNITTHKGDIDHAVFGFSPSGDKLLFRTNEFGEFGQAWSYNLKTKGKAPEVVADWDVSNLMYSPSGRYRVSSINEDSSSKVTVFDTIRNQPVVLKGLPQGDLRSIRFSDNEQSVAVSLGSDTAPAELYAADLRTGQARRLVKSMPDSISQSDLVSGEVVRFPSFDGLEIPSILYTPKEASADNKVPAVLLVHGGPGGQSRKSYSPIVQYLVNHGYAVLAVNNRGSSGYGKTFFHKDDKRHGQDDLQDMVWAKKYLASRSEIDGGKVGILGGSYGGYMVLAALAFEPEVFNVGIDIFGVSNWLRTLESIPPWWTAYRDQLYAEIGDPKKDKERLKARSPLFHANQIKKPLLVVQGANDPRVLQVESDEIVAAVRKNGVPVEYLLFPDEGHGFVKKTNRLTAIEAYLRFLDTHLKGQKPNS